MGIHSYIDIFNFILVFLLVDFVNGSYNNYLGKKLKSGVLTILALSLFALIFSVAAMFFLATKIALMVVLVFTFVLIIITRLRVKRLNNYADVEGGKEQLFSNQKVMVLVPHEDDDINLAGGIIEQYVKYGSDVYIVFSTNGDGDKRFDMSTMGYTRMSEAIKALGLLGVPEKNIVFLGYGDGWGEKGPHLYNADPDKVLSSTSERTATYGLKNHPAYSEGKSYTHSNFISDITQVVSEYRPDVIFCIDYDTHCDHRALSMFFEKAMGKILKTTHYRPVVYKGYGYRTAWGSSSDFSDDINIASTVNCPASNDVVLYDWNRRVRFPIDINSVSRSLQSSKLYKALCLYASQRANECSSRIINGDKVFFLRRTDSLLYNADIRVSSGNKNKLTDFMLLDCDNLTSCGDHPYDGVWAPDKDDSEKSIDVTLDEKRYIDNIVLYDNPSSDDNILNIVISFDDGTKIGTGKLNSNGDATIIPVRRTVKSFSLKIDKYEGTKIGLTEIEAYSTDTVKTPHFFKLTDDKGNFIYDYIIPEKGKQSVKIYSNVNEDLSSDEFVLLCDNRKCRLHKNGDEITIECPSGHKCQVQLLSRDNTVLDRVVFRNPYRIERYFMYHSLKYKKNRSYFVRISEFVKNKWFCN